MRREPVTNSTGRRAGRRARAGAQQEQEKGQEEEHDGAAEAEAAVAEAEAEVEAAAGAPPAQAYDGSRLCPWAGLPPWPAAWLSALP